MSMFKDDDQADLEVKRLILKALEDEKRKVEPYYTKLTLEIGYVKDDIKKLEEEIKKG